MSRYIHRLGNVDWRRRRRLRGAVEFNLNVFETTFARLVGTNTRVSHYRPSTPGLSRF
jgi:hypothetical protein